MPRKGQKFKIYSPTAEEIHTLLSLREKIKLITIDNGSVDPLLVDIAMYKAIARVFKSNQ
jgi:hypothetical protein